MYEVVYSDEVLLSIKKYKKSSPQSYKKVVKLINELQLALDIPKHLKEWEETSTQGK